MEMTKRVFKGISGMILMLVASVGITDANAQCTVDMNVQVNATNCFSQVFLSATASDPVVSWNYFIDGSLVGTSNTALLQLAPGVYEATVAIVTDQGCTAADNFTFTVAGNPLLVDAGSDVVVCQEQAVLSVNVNSTNPYEVSWHPAQYLSDPSIETPLVTENVTNQWFIVDVLDLVTGCVNSDTVVVTQQNPVFDSLDLCTGQAIVDLGPGANAYDWLSWTDTNGTNHPLNYPTTQQAITVTQPGQYFAVAYFPECGALTSLVTVEACTTNCFNAFIHTANSGQCSAHHFFTSTGSGFIQSWLWDFGDGQWSTEMHPDHVFAPGTYEVTLTTTNSEGCTAVSSETITVDGLHIELSNDTVGCQQPAYMEVFPSGG
ncbi:MAG: PKD domain-containing protein, partial [Bacteroidetes bacterium]